MKKRFCFPVPTIITAILSALCFCGFKVVELLENHNIYIYFLNITSDKIWLALAIAFDILLAITIISLLFNNIKRKWIPSVISVVIIFLTMFFMLLASFSNSTDRTYYQFTSPDDTQKIIIIEESSWLLRTGGCIFQKTSFCTMSKIAGFATNEYLVMQEGTYRFEWNDNGFDFYYPYSYSENEPYRVVKAEYIK